MEIGLYLIVIFCLGVITGFALKTMLGRRSKYGGTIFISQNEEKTLYSLELNDYPETIQFKKEIVFKVDSSQMSQDRD